MKKYLLMVVAAMMAISASSQQSNKLIRVYQGNTVVFEKEYNSVDSVVFVEVTPPEQPEEDDGMLPGAFSVAAYTKVHFSKGNLQYQASTQKWRFADNQYDLIGSTNSNISSTYNGWIDLFGWGTGNNPTNISTTDTDYSFTDWGINAISNGGNEANLWRTLTWSEWIYLFDQRKNATSLFGLGSVNGINGAIILPDNWSTPQGVTFTPSTTQGLNTNSYAYYNSNGNNFSHNTYTAEQWAVMEAAGAVFLPAAGGRNDTNVYDVGTNGYYWSKSAAETKSAYSLFFNSYNLNPDSKNFRHNGKSVRLVR